MGLSLAILKGRIMLLRLVVMCFASEREGDSTEEDRVSADSFDGFDYKCVDDMVDQEARRRYWACAIGLQAVDGLEVSDYLRAAAQSYVEGRRSLGETGELVRAYHTPGSVDYDAGAESSREADLVSQRIAEVLVRGTFALVPDMARIIHRQLFRDLPQDVYRPGEYKLEPLVKQEEILNGDSVLYADPALVEQSLRYLFEQEREAGDYGLTLSGDGLARFARFVALVWQVHPFQEGNTRTVAVLAALYLRQLGFDVGNEPFEHHARYFRDALVRANYRNAAAGVLPDAGYLERFFDNLANGAAHPMVRAELICPALFDNPGLLRNVSPSLALHR